MECKLQTRLLNNLQVLTETLERTVPVAVASNVFTNAAMIVAENSMQEGIGLVLRSGETKLVEKFLSRTVMSGATEAQISFLHNVGLNGLRMSLGKLGPAPTQRTDIDTFWERQFEIACIVLDRVSTRLTQEHIRNLLTELLPLSWDERLVGRVNGYDDLNRTIWRCCTLLDGKTAANILPVLLAAPVLGSTLLPRSAVRVGRWIDPVVVLRKDHPALTPEQFEIVSQAADDLLKFSAVAESEERKHLVSRLFALNERDLLSQSQQQQLADVLFQKTDENGIPTNIELWATYAVLSLPRQLGLNERELFRKGIVDQRGGDVWQALTFSVTRFGPPRERLQRSVKWTKSDLKAILDRAKEWIANATLAIQSANQSELAAAFQGIKDNTKIRFRAWLQVIEEVVLLSVNLDEYLLLAGVDAIRLAQEKGFLTLKSWPTLVQLDRKSVSDLVREIRLGLMSSDDDLVWHACCAIVRWAELERAGNSVPLDRGCLRDLGTLVLERRHRMLPLLLNTARDLVGIYKHHLDVSFQGDILDALNLLLSETAYSSNELDWSINRRIHLRQIALKLVRALRDIDAEHIVLESWRKTAREDKFEDVRRLE